MATIPQCGKKHHLFTVKSNFLLLKFTMFLVGFSYLFSIYQSMKSPGALESRVFFVSGLLHGLVVFANLLGLDDWMCGTRGMKNVKPG